MHTDSDSTDSAADVEAVNRFKETKLIKQCLSWLEARGHVDSAWHAEAEDAESECSLTSQRAKKSLANIFIEGVLTAFGWMTAGDLMGHNSIKSPAAWVGTFVLILPQIVNRYRYTGIRELKAPTDADLDAVDNAKAVLAAELHRRGLDGNILFEGENCGQFALSRLTIFIRFGACLISKTGDGLATFLKITQSTSMKLSTRTGVGIFGGALDGWVQAQTVLRIGARFHEADMHKRHGVVQPPIEEQGPYMTLGQGFFSRIVAMIGPTFFGVLHLDAFWHLLEQIDTFLSGFLPAEVGTGLTVARYLVAAVLGPGVYAEGSLSYRDFEIRNLGVAVERNLAGEYFISGKIDGAPYKVKIPIGLMMALAGTGLEVAGAVGMGPLAGAGLMKHGAAVTVAATGVLTMLPKRWHTLQRISEVVTGDVPNRVLAAKFTRETYKAVRRHHLRAGLLSLFTIALQTFGAGLIAPLIDWLSNDAFLDWIEGFSNPLTIALQAVLFVATVGIALHGVETSIDTQKGPAHDHVYDVLAGQGGEDEPEYASVIYPNDDVRGRRQARGIGATEPDAHAGLLARQGSGAILHYTGGSATTVPGDRTSTGSDAGVD